MKLLDHQLARDKLEKILSREEYQVYYREDPNLWSPFVERMKQEIREILDKLFPEVEISPHVSEWLSYGIIVVAVIIFLLFVISFSSKIVRQSRLMPVPVGTDKELTMSSYNHLKEAEKFAGDKDYQEALRHVFLAFILYLDQRGWIEAKSWKTNWEYYNELQNQSQEIAMFFYKLGVLFDETMYGDRPVEADEYGEYEEKVSRWVREDQTEWDEITRAASEGGTS